MLVVDNFLPKETFENLQKYCKENEFSIVTAGEKSFSILDVPPEIIPSLQMDGYDIILTFIRSAHKDFDNEERIHCDGIILDKKTDKAAVLYINNRHGVTKNGTKFYSHKVHGQFLPDDADEAEFNRLITDDAGDKSKWTETHYVKAKPNRLLRYNARYFHGKHPAKIKEGVRVVLVVFYKKIN